MLSIRFPILIAGALLYATTSLTATADNSKAPVNVSADNVEHDEGSGSVTYSGNVEVAQGDMMIHSDKLIIAKNGEETVITASGAPVMFATKGSRGQELQGEATNIKYEIDAKTLFMSGGPLQFRAKQEGCKMFTALASTAQYTVEGQTLMMRGTPIRFKHTQPGSKPLSGSASSADYNMAKRHLVLSGKAVLEQNGNTVKNDRIVFDLQKQRVIAGQKAQAKQRVQTTIQLKNSK